MLAAEENFSGLARINRELIGRAEAVDSPQQVVLDMDSTEIPVYGQQENSAYNAHFESTCYHPLLLFNREGDCLAANLRLGNVHSAAGWEELLLPEIERQQKQGKQVVLWADAAFAKPELYEALEERGVKYAIRLPSNDCLESDIAELLTPPGPKGAPRASSKPVVRYKSFLYQAESWKKPDGGAAGTSRIAGRPRTGANFGEPHDSGGKVSEDPLRQGLSSALKALGGGGMDLGGRSESGPVPKAVRRGLTPGAWGILFSYGSPKWKSRLNRLTRMPRKSSPTGAED